MAGLCPGCREARRKTGCRYGDNLLQALYGVELRVLGQYHTLNPKLLNSSLHVISTFLFPFHAPLLCYFPGQILGRISGHGLAMYAAQPMPFGGWGVGLRL